MSTKRPSSLRTLAARLGVSQAAISKAVREGRLGAGIGARNGRPVVLDADAACAEWAALTAQRASLPEGVPPIAQSRARLEAAKAAMAEIELGVQRGELVEASVIRSQVIDRYNVVRTRLLAVPSRVAQRLPHLSAADRGLLDDLIREALEELAARDGATS